MCHHLRGLSFNKKEKETERSDGGAKWVDASDSTQISTLPRCSRLRQCCWTPSTLAPTTMMRTTKLQTRCTCHRQSQARQSRQRIGTCCVGPRCCCPSLSCFPSARDCWASRSRWQSCRRQCLLCGQCADLQSRGRSTSR